MTSSCIRCWHRECENKVAREHCKNRPGQLPCRASVFGGKLPAGDNSLCLCLTGVILWHPRRAPWTICVHFRDSYPIDVSHPVSIFSVCCWSRYLSLSVTLSSLVKYVLCAMCTHQIIVSKSIPAATYSSKYKDDLSCTKFTCKGTLRQVFIRVSGLEIQSVMLVFSTQLCELLPLKHSL